MQENVVFQTKLDTAVDPRSEMTNATVPPTKPSEYAIATSHLTLLMIENVVRNLLC
jgi:hypothetical protein